MVVPVVRRPPQHALLGGGLGEERQDELEDAARLERAVGEVAVVPGRHPAHAHVVERQCPHQRSDQWKGTRKATTAAMRWNAKNGIDWIQLMRWSRKVTAEVDDRVLAGERCEDSMRTPCQRPLSGRRSDFSRDASQLLGTPAAPAGRPGRGHRRRVLRVAEAEVPGTLQDEHRHGPSSPARASAQATS